MGRTLMYATLVALAVFVLSATFILDHGGESIASVRSVTVHDLTTLPGTNSYVGQTVLIEQATLGYSEEHDLYQVVDPGANYAVVIREFSGSTDLAELLDQDVTVSGIFGIDEELGVYIDAGTVHTYVAE
jgi:hypothetical protein